MVTLDNETKQAIIEAIREAERRTSGEIRVHIRSKCRGDALKAAADIFKRLRMDRTRDRSSVLIFLALDSHAFAVLGDKGIHERVGNEFWSETRDIMTSYFARGDLRGGILQGIRGIGEKLSRYFPFSTGDQNELPDNITRD
jgi:uncharacterized membrane protein